MDLDNQKLDYNMLLLNHLNRLSATSSNGLFDIIPKELNDRFTNAPSIGTVSLSNGIQFLHCIIPDELKDAEYKKNTAGKSFTKDYFLILAQLINLLNRKGLLLSKQISVRRNKTDTTEEFEND